MMGACALTLGACVDEVPSDDFGPSPAVESNGVYFPNTMQTSYELGEANEPAEVTEKTGSFTLPVERTNPDQAVTIEVTTEMDAETAAVFSVPTSVTFEAGSATSELVVNYTAAQRGVTYKLNISFGEGTEYAASYQTITALYPALEIWEPISTEAVLVDQMFSMFGASDVVIEGLTVEKLQGKYRYRFRSPYDDTPRIENTDGSLYSYWYYMWGVSKLMEDGFELPYIVLDGEAYLPAKDDGSREYTDEELAELDESLRLYYIAPTALGFRMENGVGCFFDATWNAFGSVAYNLGNSSGAFTEEDYPLGSYNKSKEMFDFGAVYHNIDDGGDYFYPIDGGFELWLNPAKMTVVYDRDYQPWESASDMAGAMVSQFVGRTYNVQVDQGTLPEGETDPIYRLVSPYAKGVNIAFFHNKETGSLRVPKGQATGLSTYGNDIYVDVTRATYDAELNAYTFICQFYYNMADGDKTTKAILAEVTETFRPGWEPIDDLQGKPIDEYVGMYLTDFTYLNDGSTITQRLTITKKNDLELVVNGLAPAAAQQLGYDPDFVLQYDPETGQVAAMPQQVDDFMGMQVIGLPGYLDGGSIYGSENDMIVGGFNEDGDLELLNPLTNEGEYQFIYFAMTDGSILDPYVCSLTWTPYVPEAGQAATAQQLAPAENSLQFERLVRQFMPKFTKPVTTSSAPKLVKSIEGVQTQRFEMVKK